MEVGYTENFHLDFSSESWFIVPEIKYQLEIESLNDNMFNIHEIAGLGFRIKQALLAILWLYLSPMHTNNKVITKTFWLNHKSINHLLSKMIKSSSVVSNRALAAAKLILQHPSPSTILL